MKHNKSIGITIKDIARYTGYSIATVSRVSNEYGVFYSKETYKKIKKAIDDLNYYPNVIARSLKTQRTYNIAFLEPWTSEFFSEIFLGIKNSAYKAGYTVAIFSSNFDKTHEDRNISSILSNRMDGVIISSAILNNDSINKLISHNIPLVIIEKFIDLKDVPTISIKNLEISRKAVNYLLELGHKKIGFIGETLEVGRVDSRFRGYKKALEEKGVAFNQEYIFISEKFVGEDYFESFKYLTKNIQKIKNCTAFFITSDSITITLIKALKNSGLSVPGDVSVIGFDGLEISKYINPSLTTILQPRYEMGHQAMRMLLKVIKGEKTDNVELKAELVIGESTAPYSEKT